MEHFTIPKKETGFHCTSCTPVCSVLYITYVIAYICKRSGVHDGVCQSSCCRMICCKVHSHHPPSLVFIPILPTIFSALSHRSSSGPCVINSGGVCLVSTKF